MADEAALITTQRTDLLRRIQMAVRAYSGRRIRREEAQVILDLVMEETVAAAVRDGIVRLPRGLGALELRDMKPRSHVMPSGTAIDVPKTQRLRFKPGLVTAELICQQGDLTSAYAARKKIASRERVQYDADAVRAGRT